MDAPKPLGIDNVVFAVDDLDAAIGFYERCGFCLKFRIDASGLAVFAIGGETPGLILRLQAGEAGRLWVEVEDAASVARYFEAMAMATTMIATASGATCEVSDPSGNVIGFADYSKRPEMARPR